LNNFIREAGHPSHSGGAGICGWKGFSHLADGSASDGGGANTGQADWSFACVGSAVGTDDSYGDGGICAGNGKR